MPNCNCQWRSSPDACGHHQPARAGQGGTGCMLRVRTTPECPEDNLKELTWDSNPNCGIAREREKKKGERTFPRKALTKAQLGLLTEQRIEWHQRRASQLWTGPPLLEAERQAGGSQSHKSRGNLSPRNTSSAKLLGRSQLLTKSSWDTGWLTSARRVIARDQLLRGDTQNTWDWEGD